MNQPVADRRGLAILLVTILALPSPLLSQAKRLTIDDLYDPKTKIDFTGSAPASLAWISNTHYVWRKTEASKGTEWFRVEAMSGKTEPLFSASKLEAALARLPGLSREEASRLARLPHYVMNEGGTALVLSAGTDLYHYDVTSDKLTRLTFEPGEKEEVSLSPDGSLVAFVSENNLHLVEIASQRSRALTTDGGPEILNAKLDWVYQEEIYGRGSYKGYWWSPDSSRIAFLQLHEKAVPRYTLVDDTSYTPTLETTPYPKAGDPNPIAKLGVVRVTGSPPRFLPLEKYADADFLIVNVTWTRNSQEIIFQIQDREQTWLDLNSASATTLSSRTLLRETSPAWVDRPSNPVWLRDGSFLWLSERSGFKHVYHCQSDGTLIRQVTDGKWDVRSLHGVDETQGVAYFSGTEGSPIGVDTYSVGLDSARPRRISSTSGTHSAIFNPALTMYLDSWSDVLTPTQVRLHRADGGEIRVVQDSKVPALREYQLGKPEFLQVKARDGMLLEAMILKPPDFDPALRYPVYQHTYGGPAAPQVRNAWGGTSYMFHQMLAQKGIIVWICDNRTASGKGFASTRQAYRRFGETELEDIEDGVAWLKSQPWVDPQRIGIFGWSFGGFMVTYALTHSHSFAMGIAGGPVTDWRSYDSIYTERYMGLPPHNLEGYKKTAPRFAAKDLSGKLLLIHGALDDNVHPQNTLQLALELQNAGKPFRLMLYPKSRHGVTDPKLVKHLRSLMVDFIEETLRIGMGP